MQKYEKTIIEADKQIAVISERVSISDYQDTTAQDVQARREHGDSDEDFDYGGEIDDDTGVAMPAKKKSPRKKP